MNALVAEIAEVISHQRSNGLGRQCDHHEHWSDSMRSLVNDHSFWLSLLTISRTICLGKEFNAGKMLKQLKPLQQNSRNFFWSREASADSKVEFELGSHALS
jgi:hypothetical protein